MNIILIGMTDLSVLWNKTVLVCSQLQNCLKRLSTRCHCCNTNNKLKKGENLPFSDTLHYRNAAALTALMLSKHHKHSYTQIPAHVALGTQLGLVEIRVIWCQMYFGVEQIQ